MGTGTITRRMESVLTELRKEFQSLNFVYYTRSDFEKVLKRLKAAESTSERPSILKRLRQMLNICEIDYDKTRREYAYYEKVVADADIPEFADIEAQMLKALLFQFEKYPSPKEYLKRTVDRLCTKEDGWENDSLRLRILKQFIKYGDYLNDAGYRGKTFLCGYVKEVTGAKKVSDEDVLNALDDTIFSVLSNATDAQKKPGGKYGLLKIADDLAAGKFHSGGATKKGLYLFAMVYGMTFCLDEEKDYERDIEKNLFQDYYTNNLIRFISEKYECPSGQGINYKNFAEMVYLYFIANEGENQPKYSPQEKVRLSGEMIEAIKKNGFKQGHTDAQAAGGTRYYRGLVRPMDANVSCEDILRKSNDDFVAFICEHYNCDVFEETANGKGNAMGVLELESEQHTAFRVYREIVEDLRALQEKKGESLENCNYGLYFTDMGAFAKFAKKGYKKELFGEAGVDEKLIRFIRMLMKLNRFLGYTPKEKESNQNENQETKKLSKRKTASLFEDRASEMTRTKLIVAYYYYFNACHLHDESEELESFENVFKTFELEVNEKLQEAMYQELSGRNLFDVLVVFSSYAYLNY